MKAIEMPQTSTPAAAAPATPGSDLIDDPCWYVEAPRDEVDAPRITAGQPVPISLDAFPRQSFAGKVRRVAPYVSAVEKQARTVDIEATFTDPATPDTLLVGYSADIEVILAVRENVLRIPSSALLNGNRVLVAGADGKLAERTVSTGLANWEFTEVLSGLTTGEQVVTSLERAGVTAGAPYVLDSRPPAAGK